MSLDTTHLHKGMLWTWRVHEGKLLAREAGGDWHDVGLPGDVAALHEFFGVAMPPKARWMPWHPVRNWWLRRRAKRIYAHWYETKHKRELEEKRRRRLVELNSMFVRKAR